MLYYENNLFYPVYISNEKFENCINLLIVTDKKSHIISILRILTDLCAIRQAVKRFWWNIKEFVCK